MAPSIPADHAEVSARMRTLAAQTLAIAEKVRLLFVTNLHDGEIADRSPNGLLNAAQYYTRQQADEIIHSLQGLGLTVNAFFSELDFLTAVTSNPPQQDGKINIVFTTAEGGTGSGRRALVPATCNLLSLPVLNSGAHACSLARHKFHAYSVLRQVGVRAPGTWLFRDGSWVGGSAPARGSKVIIKPTYESMCIGVGDESVQVVGGSFPSRIEEAHERFGQPVLVQEFVTGEEVGVPIIRIGSTYPLPPVSFRRANGEPFGSRPRTFEDENVARDTSFTPFDGSGLVTEALQKAAVLAFDALEMVGVGRIDFRVDVDGRPWVIDTNESPPPLAHTSYAKTMSELGFSLKEMLAVWIGACLFEYGFIQESDQKESSQPGTSRA